ncbi:MAG TPA: hypothetical protein VNA26_04820 [Chitinophagaceae bacterium]|nr:hypothetical protein [Chitinophagaceae bacterium]
MKIILFLNSFLFFHFSLHGQSELTFLTVRKFSSADISGSDNYSFSKRKLFQRNHGAILGLQRGRSTSIELGVEAHWRKIALKKPRITGASLNMEYNFGNHVIGYKAGMWTKRGRVNLTYGGNLVYFNDFKGLHRYGAGPAIGFRLAGFHLINGYNFLAGDKELDKVNTLYMTLRYYFPLENKFTWDRKTMKKKERRKKEKSKRKEQREKEKMNGEKKGIRKLFDFK